MKVLRITLLAAVTAAMLASCGGGSSESGTAVSSGGTGTTGSTGTTGTADPSGGTSGTGSTGTTGSTGGSGSTGGTGTTGSTGGTTPTTPAAPGPYKIAGRVSGLDSAITLRNSDGQTLTVTPTGSDTSFSFPSTVATGSAYKVSVASLPSRQNCAVSNAEGVVPTSDVVSVAVTCTSRAWTIGQQLESDDATVLRSGGGIDQLGRVTAVFVKNGGSTSNTALFATRGTPGAAGGVVQWSTAVRIDSAALPLSPENRSASLAVSPSGYAHLAWISPAPCTANTFRTSGTCYYIYSSILTPNSNVWNPPALVGDLDGVNGFYDPIQAMVNNRGDAAIQYGGYKISPPPTRVSRAALAVRASGDVAFKISILDEFPDTSAVLSVLDNSGGVVAAAQRPQSNSTNRDIKAYIGNVAAGVVATTATVVDQIANDATLDSLRVGSTGDALLMWRQNDGTGGKLFAAVRAVGTITWSAPAIVTNSSANGISVVTDSGEATYYTTSCNRYVRDRSSNTWAAKLPVLPSNCSVPDDDRLMASDGSYMSFGSTWITYNQGDNTMSRLPNAPLLARDYLLGFQRSWASAGMSMFTKTVDGNYVGAYLATGEFDVLPTPTATSGIGRNNISNLWGFFLK